MKFGDACRKFEQELRCHMQDKIATFNEEHGVSIGGINLSFIETTQIDSARRKFSPVDVDLQVCT